MTRIPAGQISTDDGLTPGDTVSRRVVKSGRLQLDPESVMVGPAPATTRPPVKPASTPVPSTPVPPPGDEALVQALAGAERNFERRLASEVARAEKAAYERGYVEGQEASASQVRNQNEIFRTAEQGFQRAWESLAEHSEPLLVELAFRMAEAILESPLPEGVRTLATGALSDAIESMGDSRSVQVTVHPADYMMLDESGILVPLSRNHPNLNWRTDAALDRGDWEARSDGAVIRRVAMELLKDLRASLSNLSDSPNT